jgi:hypothetical protein
MCRHCERIVEYPEDKPAVHAFMELSAKRLSELRGQPIGADDIEAEIVVTSLEAVNVSLESVARVHRLLREMHR